MIDLQPEEKSWLKRARVPILIYIICLAGYAGVSNNRLKQPSSDNHYVYLADSLLHGRLAIEGTPPHQNDWSRVLELTLKDGRKVRGAFLQTIGTDRFKTTRGEKMVIPSDQIASQSDVYYVSFPWFPAVLMLPFVAIFGLKFNDVIFTVVLAAFNPVLVYFVLRRLNALKLSLRTIGEDLWLVLMFAFGTVHFYSSVLGQVWYTAHIVGVALTCLYVLAALEGKHPFLAGVFLGLGFVTRTPIPFAFPLIVGEILRHHLRAASATENISEEEIELWPRIKSLWPRIQWKPVIRDGVMVAIPILVIAVIACVLNYLRFDSPTEFGHTYLNVRWAERIQRWGLFNYHYLSRNLSVLLAGMPKIMAQAPYVKISWHGLGIFLTTPLFLYVLWPKRRSPIQPWLYLSILFPMILHLLYQNSGWLQFGYRFSLDYTIFLVALLAIGGRKLGSFAKSLVILGILVNIFGAITFGKYWDFYWDGFFPVS